MINMCFFNKENWFPYSLNRYIKSDTASRLGIDNFPKDPEVMNNLHLLHDNIIFPVAWNYGKAKLKINSVFRCLELNRALKSKDTSQHIKGQAVDFEIVGLDNEIFFEWCKKKLDYDQLILEFYKAGEPSSGWIHCSFNLNKNRKQDFKIGG